MTECGQCKLKKEDQEFYECKARWNGLSYRCKLCFSDYYKKRYAKHSDIIKARVARYKVNNPEKRKEQEKAYCAKNSVKAVARATEWVKNNRERYNKSRRELQARKLKTNPNYRLARILRRRLHNYLFENSIPKKGSAIQDLGCTVDECRRHLEAQFKPGMTWDNHGQSGWHIDHIRPLASFDLSDPDQVKKACHYTNLQPLWAGENMSKGDTHLSP